MTLSRALILICTVVATQASEDVSSSHLIDPVSSLVTSPRPGHLKPLGSESIRHPVLVIHEFPTPMDFFLSYVYPSIPVIIKDGAKRSPAFHLWSDEYLRSLPGSQELVDVEMRKVEDRQLPTMRMPFDEFLARYKLNDEYLVNGVPDFLKKDVLIPPPLHCSSITANLVDAILWFSGGGTKSHVHTDYVDNINCLFRGQKEFLFINYTQYKHQIVFDHPEGFYSSVDVERVDYDKYPGMKDIEFLEAKLEAGDCLYVPFKWIHQVNSFGSNNIAVNIWWNHRAYVIPSKATCSSHDPGLSLADVKLHFHEPTDANRGLGLNPELDFVKNPSESLATFMKEEDLNSLTMEQFLKFSFTILPLLDFGDLPQESMDIVHEIFLLLDLDSDGQITSMDMDKYPQQLNTFEMFHIHLGQKMMMLSDVVDGQINRQKEEILKKLTEDASDGVEDGTTFQEKLAEAQEKAMDEL